MKKGNRNYFAENTRLKKAKKDLEKEYERLKNAKCSCTARKSKAKPAPSNQKTSDGRHARLRAGRKEVDAVDGTQAALADVSRLESSLTSSSRQSTPTRPSTSHSGTTDLSKKFLRRRLSKKQLAICTSSTVTARARFRLQTQPRIRFLRLRYCFGSIRPVQAEKSLSTQRPRTSSRSASKDNFL